MPKAIRAKFEDLSLQPKETRSKKIRKARPASKYIQLEEWVYGYHLKNRHFRILAEEYRLPWQKNPGGVMFRLAEFITDTSGVWFKITATTYRGRPARIATFLKDDGRKRLERNEYSFEQMEKVREVIGIAAGTKPKWFDLTDNDSNAEFSSDDESFPHVEIRPTSRCPEPEVPIKWSGNAYEVWDSSDDSFDESSNEDEGSDMYSDKEEGSGMSSDGDEEAD